MWSAKFYSQRNKENCENWPMESISDLRLMNSSTEICNNSVAFNKNTTIHYARHLKKTWYLTDFPLYQDETQDHFILGGVHELMHGYYIKSLVPSAFPILERLRC